MQARALERITLHGTAPRRVKTRNDLVERRPIFRLARRGCRGCGAALLELPPLLYDWAREIPLHLLLRLSSFPGACNARSNANVELRAGDGLWQHKPAAQWRACNGLRHALPQLRLQQPQDPLLDDELHAFYLWEVALEKVLAAQELGVGCRHLLLQRWVLEHPLLLEQIHTRGPVVRRLLRNLPRDTRAANGQVLYLGAREPLAAEHGGPVLL
mmetsp:Transcript_15504/g.32732  ORF Transcript_15504/g.32732 Transcript_15504/m.32732 type:complete len:214 (+) Transcript_15504:991-1632(+)